MNTSKLNLNRIRTLYEKGSSSLSDYEAAKNSYRTAVASFESSKRSVAIQQDQIKFGYLYASENGAIASVSAEIDERTLREIYFPALVFSCISLNSPGCTLFLAGIRLFHTLDYIE